MGAFWMVYNTYITLSDISVVNGFGQYKSWPLKVEVIMIKWCKSIDWIQFLVKYGINMAKIIISIDYTDHNLHI